MIVVSHRKDLDGIASAAIAYRYLTQRAADPESIKILLTEPAELPKVLKKIVSRKELSNNKVMIISDIGVNSDSFNTVLHFLKLLRATGTEILWFDHHKWSKEELAKVKEYAKVVIDNSKCAAELVYENLCPNDQHAKRLAELARDSDFWINKDPLAVKLSKVISSNKIDKLKLIKTLASGTLWDPKWDKIYELQVKREEELIEKALRNMKKLRVHDVTLCIAKGKAPASVLGDRLRNECDIIALVTPRGNVSLRRGNNNIDLSEIAKLLGGGGHPFAAGGTLGYNIIDRLLARLGCYRKTSKIIDAVKTYLQSCRAH